MTCGACDVHYFLLFVPIVLIPFFPTSVLYLQPVFGLLYGAKQVAWHSNICLLLLGLIKFYLFISLECRPLFLISDVSSVGASYLVWSMESSRYLCSISYFSGWATSIRIIQTAWERRARTCKPSLQPLPHPVLTTDAESVQPAQDKHTTLGPAHIKAWPVQAGLESQRLTQVLLTLQRKTTKPALLGYFKHSFKIGSSQRNKKK